MIANHEYFLGSVTYKVGDVIFNVRQTIIAQNTEMAYNILHADVLWNSHFNEEVRVISFGLVE